ncbi:MAG: GIY-YIG nuclease family protein [Candidatus Omnitrophica bacterium]|nr:GIY-YIG nuclease family protein [Candidatus Omnitrophota bacterium]MBU4478420.1 GIY-YIG nuclease family protein [Candidatus Omnitrophota bacterium]
MSPATLFNGNKVVFDAMVIINFHGLVMFDKLIGWAPEEIVIEKSIKKEASHSMNGPIDLALVNSSNNAVYVGRSDTDLNSRLKNHLPEREDNAWVRRSFPTDFYFESTANSQEAYRLECEWFHKYRPSCNNAHPAKLSYSWACPICGL